VLSKTAYLILTSGSKKQYGPLLEDLEKSRAASKDLYILFDLSLGHVPPDDERIIAFDKDKLATLNLPFFLGGNVGFGNTHLPLLYFSQLKPHFSHFWLIEDDVRFTGNFDVFFDELNSYDHHFISSKIRAYDDTPNFMMWKWITRNDQKVSDNFKLWSFNPIYRISQKAIDTVQASYADGWLGHFEVLIPSILNHRSLSMMDFGGNGPYTPKELINKYYRSGKTLNETYRYRPPHVIPLRKNLLYHPVKTFSKALKIYRRMIWLKYKAITSKTKT